MSLSSLLRAAVLAIGLAIALTLRNVWIGDACLLSDANRFFADSGSPAGASLCEHLPTVREQASNCVVAALVYLVCGWLAARCLRQWHYLLAAAIAFDGTVIAHA